METDNDKTDFLGQISKWHFMNALSCLESLGKYKT